jgi:1-acyl-sn-glycerol-3-phosphate acyltransferase
MNSYSFLPFILQTLMWFFARPTLWIFGRLQVFGKENLYELSNTIIAANHLSDLDPILIPATLGPRSPLMPVFSVALERSFYNRPWPLNYLYGGTLFNMLGAYAVSIGTKGDYEHILASHIHILEKGGTVGIFPEGGRNLEGEVGEGKVGVAFLLWRTGVPVVPVAVRGHHEMFARDFFFRDHSINVSYGKPITREELFGPKNEKNVPPTQEELKAATAVIMSRIREMYDRI